MMMKMTKNFGKPICVALYALGAYYLAKGKPVPFLVLFMMHLTEYFTVARKLAAEKGIQQLAALANCLSFGFTWWLPIKKGV